LNQNDKKVLAFLQRNLPIVSRPFSELAKRLNLSEENLLAKIKKFLSEKNISRIGPVFDSRRLGYKSTLITVKVPQKKLEQIIPVINHLKGVTHNYLREDEYNLWFTLTAPSETVLQKTIAQLKERTGIKDLLNLKAKKMFKIDTSFAVSSKERKIKNTRKISPSVGLTQKNRKLINRLSYSIPLQSEPFKGIAEELGIKEEEVLNKISSWLKKGIIRRVSAVVKPTKIGMEGAALGVWKVENEKIDKVGKLMAEFPQVSHCYQRVTYPEWRYNLYTMIHGKDKKDCQRIADKISEKTRVSEHKLLFTQGELKKESMHYFEE
jgi:DNA-binding Lrp family transcriptional regulator